MLLPSSYTVSQYLLIPFTPASFSWKYFCLQDFLLVWMEKCYRFYLNKSALVQTHVWLVFEYIDLSRIEFFSRLLWKNTCGIDWAGFKGDSNPASFSGKSVVNKFLLHLSDFLLFRNNILSVSSIIGAVVNSSGWCFDNFTGSCHQS